MARNHKFFFDRDGCPRARGPSSEKMLMAFLEQDVQGSDHICRDLMDDLTAIEDESDDAREFIGNAHRVSITPDGVIIALNVSDEPVTDQTVSDSSGADQSGSDASEASRESGVPGESEASGESKSRTAAGEYHVALKHFREVLEDWEAFILDDQLDDSLADDDYL